MITASTESTEVSSVERVKSLLLQREFAPLSEAAAKSLRRELDVGTRDCEDEGVIMSDEGYALADMFFEIRAPFDVIQDGTRLFLDMKFPRTAE